MPEAAANTPAKAAKEEAPLTTAAQLPPPEQRGTPRSTPLTLEELQRLIKVPLALLRLLRKLLTGGYFEVETPFTFRQQQYRFLTVIQLDADLVNYIPDVRNFLPHKQGKQVFIDHYLVHQGKVLDVFAQFQQNALFWQRVLETALVAGNVAIMLYQFIDGIALQEAGVTGAVAGLSLLFNKYLTHRTVRWIIRRLYGVLRWGMGFFR